MCKTIENVHLDVLVIFTSCSCVTRTYRGKLFHSNPIVYFVSLVFSLFDYLIRQLDVSIDNDDDGDDDDIEDIFHLHMIFCSKFEYI